jgi:hypothetical protein
MSASENPASSPAASRSSRVNSGVRYSPSGIPPPAASGTVESTAAASVPITASAKAAAAVITVNLPPVPIVTHLLVSA